MVVGKRKDKERKWKLESSEVVYVEAWMSTNYLNVQYEQFNYFCFIFYPGHLSQCC